MDLIARILDSGWGLLTISSVVSLATGASIVAFGAPPVTMVWVAYGMAAVLSPLTSMAHNYRLRHHQRDR